MKKDEELLRSGNDRRLEMAGWRHRYLGALVLASIWFFCSLGAAEAAHLRLKGQSDPLLFFQPAFNDYNANWERLVFLDQQEEENFRFLDAKKLFLDGIVYHRYWQLSEDDAYAFHPSALGAAMYRAVDQDVQTMREIFASATALAIELPNGGVTWYYPKVYPINRMLGPYYQYSALTQGALLRAAMRVENKYPSEFEGFAKKVADGMLLPYAMGGVLWRGNVFLELPIYFAPPEVVLNGWISALLDFGDFARNADDASYKDVFRSSVNELANMLPDFDDPARRLSLYSNATPVRAHIRKTLKDQKFGIVFDAQDASLPSYEIDLEKLDPITIRGKQYRSPYNSQIVAEKDSVLTATISCNKSYDTFLVSESPFSVTFETGIYDVKRATPGSGGGQIVLESEASAQGYVVHFDRERDKMFCGYPTNFGKKGGKNFYHQYHVVGLLSLAASYPLDTHTRCRLIEFALKWKSYSSEQENMGRKLTKFQKVIDIINGQKLHRTFEAWQDLLDWAIAQRSTDDHQKAVCR